MSEFVLYQTRVKKETIIYFDKICDFFVIYFWEGTSPGLAPSNKQLDPELNKNASRLNHSTDYPYCSKRCIS